MRLSSFADYAVVLMSAAARHCGGARMNAPEVLARLSVPGVIRSGALDSRVG